MNIPPELLTFLREKNDFFIATHINPEGDALGSSLALSMALNAIGKNTVLFDRDGVPQFYRFLPDHEQIMQDCTGVQSSDYYLLLLDCNTPERAGIEGLTFRETAVIDHHETESDFGDIRWIDDFFSHQGIGSGYQQEDGRQSLYGDRNRYRDIQIRQYHRRSASGCI
jgi:phosphoesterase RecJ-like protein